MNNQFYNPYYTPSVQPIYRPNEQQLIPQQQNIQAMQQIGVQPIKNSLQGELSESIEQAKNLKINMDGSITYIPIADGSAIVTKQTQADGSTKTIIFKPITEQKEQIKYVTSDELQKAINKLNLDEIDDIKEDIKDIKKQLKSKKAD